MLRGLLNISRHTLRLLWFITNIVLMMMFVFAAYGGYINPDRMAFAQAVNLSFPFWIILAVILLLLNLLLWRRLSLVWILVMIICAGPVYTIVPVNFCRANPLCTSDSSRVFKVMSYNVFMLQDDENPDDRTDSRTIRYILDMNPDIVCLQESGRFFLNPDGRFVELRKMIMERYPYRTNIDSGGEFVLSKYPIENITPWQPQWGSGTYQAYDVEVNGHNLVLINAHFQSMGLDDDDRIRYRDLASDLKSSPREELSFVRRTLLSKLNTSFRYHGEQARHLVAFIDSVCPDKDSNVIVAGDFNDAPGSYLYRTLCNRLHLKDAYSEVAFGPTVTYNRNRFYFRIDHILYRGDMEAIDMVRGDLKSSDHYPLTATFRWNDT